MRRFAFALLLFILSLGFAYSNADSIIISYAGYNEIEVDHLTDRAELLNITQKIYLVPLDDEVVNYEFNNLTVVDNYLYFNQVGDFSSSGWSFNYIINSHRLISMIKDNPVFPYPVSELPSQVLPFLEFTEKIDLVEGVADEIVSGVSDYLTAVLLIGEYVYEHVNYTFTEPYINETLKASQVHELGRGVCDEYAVLFASLARSLGIPVKYVTGYAYGNVLGLSSFGPHAWVQVYVPGHGWIGMDPTYGQFGWYDASHVSVVKGYNVSSNFITTASSGYYLDELHLVNNLPDFMTASFGAESSGFTIESVINESQLINASLSLSSDLVGEQDYFLLNLTITNPTSDYIPLSYSVVSTQQMELVNASAWRPIILEPGTTNSYYTLMRAPVIGAHVSHPIEVYLPLFGTLNTSVEVDPLLVPSSSASELLLLMNGERVLLKSVELVKAELSPNLTYDGTDLIVSLRNVGNTELRNVKLSVFGDLTSDFNQTINRLGINQLVNLTIPLEVISKGEGMVRLYINYGDKLLTDELSLISAVNPILGLNYEGNRSFRTTPQFILKVINSLQTIIPLMNLTITTPRQSLTKSFTPNNASVYEVNTEFPIEWLDYGSNEVLFRIDYVDQYGTNFSNELTLSLERKGEWWEEWLERIMIFLNSLFN